MKLNEHDLRLLLEAALRQAERQEAKGSNPFAYEQMAQRLRDELARVQAVHRAAAEARK